MDESDVREKLLKSSYPYLAAFENEWIDAELKTMSFDEMGKTYLQRCYNMLEPQKYDVEHGFVLKEIKVKKSQEDKASEIIKDLYYRKIKELKEYLQ